MVQLRHFDARLVALQRQGRVGFHGTCRGQEAIPIGLAAGTRSDDLFFPGLRDHGVLWARGQPLSTWLAQSFGSVEDPTRGRQMPAHPSDRRHHVVSSCIGTQIPQAVGAARGLRGSGRIVVAAFGDGACSTGDFHAGCQLAGLWKVPVVLVCENNGWAISAPTELQWAADGLEKRVESYGLPFHRVDGNDVLAVEAVVRDAAERARTDGRPSFVECVTYRTDPHSTSDDPQKYRDADEEARQRGRDPILQAVRALGDEGRRRREAAEKAAKAAFDEALRYAEQLPLSEAGTEDVLADIRDADEMSISR